MQFSLDDVVIWGRSRREYELMFALCEADRRKTILGCGDGPASFNAEMAADGYSVVSVDPIYELAPAAIRARFEEVAGPMIERVKALPDRWTWGYHRDADSLLAYRRRVLERFVTDYQAARGGPRYRTAQLPRLPFADRQFELALCSHLLFLYSSQLSESFHVASALELCRVAGEVRIFPIHSLEMEASPHLAAVREAAARNGLSSEIVDVDYEFQRGAHEMLRLYRG